MWSSFTSGYCWPTFGHHVLPELEGFQHVGLVDARDLLAALARRLEGDVGDALDLRARVAHGVEGFLGAREVAVGRSAPSPRLAEVDVAGQLPDDQDVQAGHQLRLEAGSVGQLLVADRRTEVGEQAQVLAQSQDGLLRTELALQLVVLPVAHGAEQHGIGPLRQLERGLRQRMAVPVIGQPADVGEFQLELEVQDLQDLDGLVDDFGADAISPSNLTTIIYNTNPLSFIFPSFQLLHSSFPSLQSQYFILIYFLILPLNPNLPSLQSSISSYSSQHSILILPH
jgi:hypothetical protein